MQLAPCESVCMLIANSSFSTQWWLSSYMYCTFSATGNKHIDWKHSVVPARIKDNHESNLPPYSCIKPMTLPWPVPTIQCTMHSNVFFLLHCKILNNSTSQSSDIHILSVFYLNDFTVGKLHKKSSLHEILNNLLPLKSFRSEVVISILSFCKYCFPTLRNDVAHNFYPEYLLFILRQEHMTSLCLLWLSFQARQLTCRWVCTWLWSCRSCRQGAPWHILVTWANVNSVHSHNIAQWSAGLWLKVYGLKSLSWSLSD